LAEMENLPLTDSILDVSRELIGWTAIRGD
jgi:hypothetical protein